MFEGEKYLGTTDNAFEVISIFIWPKNSEMLQGLKKHDFEFIQKEIRRVYPNAIIDWKSPIKEFLKKAKEADSHLLGSASFYIAFLLKNCSHFITTTFSS